MRRADSLSCGRVCRSRPHVVSAQDKTADQGVYTSAQAARGATVFDAHCVSCHREGGTAPVLAGERFTQVICRCHAPVGVHDDPDHDAAQRAGLADREGIRRRRGASAEAEWLPGRHDRAGRGRVSGTSRFRARAAASNSAWCTSSDACPDGPGMDAGQSDRPGSNAGAGSGHGRRGCPTRSARPSDPVCSDSSRSSGAASGWTGQKVAAKGFLTRSGTEERVNVTSMRALTTPCPD